MSTPCFFQLGRISVVDVTGDDAATIVQNLTTGDIQSLEVGAGCESFVTDVRGKTLAHVHLYRENDFLRLLGPKDQSERIAAHVDRYTIREDATPTVRDDEFESIVLPPEVAAVVSAALNPGGDSSHGTRLHKSVCKFADADVDCYQTRWLGEGTAVLLVPRQSIDGVCETLAKESGLSGFSARDDLSSFHRARTLAGFPWFGIDLDETNLPQEADRDELAISFTKGCYLGQETVARLDAMGQVQKKLVRWSIANAVPDAGTKLVSGEKTVGRLTSVAADGDGGAVAIGMARRSHFDAGSTATGVMEPTGEEFTATFTATVH